MPRESSNSPSDFALRYSRSSGFWSIRHVLSGRSVLAKRVRIDAPCRTWRVPPGEESLAGELLVVGALNASEILSLSGNGAVAGDLRILPDGPAPPGKVNPDPMLEWVALYDEGSRRWVVYRHGVEGVTVTTEDLSIECHAISSGGALHCFCEMLARGATNKTDKLVDCDSVRLRTLRVHNQEVAVPIMGEAKPLSRSLY